MTRQMTGTVSVCPQMQVGSEKAAYKHPRSDSTSPRSSGSSAQACARNASTLANRLLHGGVVARLDLFPGVRVHNEKCTIFPVVRDRPGAEHDAVDKRRRYRRLTPACAEAYSDGAPAQLAYERAAHFQWSCIACAHSYHKCSGTRLSRRYCTPGQFWFSLVGEDRSPARHTPQGVAALCTISCRHEEAGVAGTVHRSRRAARGGHHPQAESGEA